MTDRYLILHARPYDFTDASGRQVKGCTVTYLQDQQEEGQGGRGVAALQISATEEVWFQLSALPGRYLMDFRQRPGKNNRPVTMLTGVRFCEPVDLWADADSKT